MAWGVRCWLGVYRLLLALHVAAGVLAAAAACRPGSTVQAEQYSGAVLQANDNRLPALSSAGARALQPRGRAHASARSLSLLSHLPSRSPTCVGVGGPAPAPLRSLPLLRALTHRTTRCTCPPTPALPAAGVGPAPVPMHKLRAQHLEAAIRALQQPRAREAAARAAALLRRDVGLDVAVAHLYRGLSVCAAS